MSRTVGRQVYLGALVISGILGVGHAADKKAENGTSPVAAQAQGPNGKDINNAATAPQDLDDPGQKRKQARQARRSEVDNAQHKAIDSLKAEIAKKEKLEDAATSEAINEHLQEEAKKKGNEGKGK